MLYGDGSYSETRYTDMVGDETVFQGVYRFAADGAQLILSPSQGGVEVLHQVNYRGHQYWVRAEDKERIRDPSDTWFRQISLRDDVR